MIQAGFARVDITPPLGSPMSGYFYKRFAEGVLDPLSVNALAFGNGAQTAIILSADIAGMTENYADEVRALVEQRTGVPAVYVMICALHQHTSVCVAPNGNHDAIKDSVYLHMLYRKMADAAVMAVKDMSEAEVSVAAEQTAEQIAFVRRYVMPDGTVATNPSRRGPLPVRPCDEPDNTVRLIRFKREGKKDIAYVNFSTHPDVISGSKLSADWLGFTRRFVEQDNADVHCICITGFQGDSNHCDHLTRNERTLSREFGYQHSEHMGRVIADTVKRIWDHTEVHTGETIFAEKQVVYNKTNTEGEEEYAAQKAFYEDYEAGKFEKPPHISLLARAKRIINLRTTALYHAIPITVLGLGDLAFVGIGGEPFTYYTYATVALAKGKTVFCSSNSNGYVGYLPHERAYSEGGYETSSTVFTKELQGQILSTVKDMLEKF